jgi:ribosomal protein S27AE
MHNLAIIKARGEESFLELEKERWNCVNCGGVVCIHHGTCNMCGKAKEVKLNTEENWA